MLQTAKAIVLRTTDVKESSRIATLLTDQYGKIAVMARGARRPKNASAGVIEVGNIIEIVYYYKATRSVQTMKEASILHKTYGLRSDFEKQAIVAPTLELLDQITHEAEDSSDIFNFAVNMIRWVNNTDESVINLFPYIQVRIADLMGHGLQLLLPKQALESSVEQLSPLYLTIDHGVIAQDSHSSNAFKLTTGQATYLILALQAKSSRVLHVTLERIERKNLVQHLDVYLQYHIEGVKDRRSDNIYEQLI